MSEYMCLFVCPCILYILRQSVFDAHLIGPDGFDRISQSDETHSVGFRYLVLTDQFVVHPGYKQPSMSKPGLRANLLLFREFMVELRAKYAPHRRVAAH